jgi:hypothetical protein
MPGLTFLFKKGWSVALCLTACSRYISFLSCLIFSASHCLSLSEFRHPLSFENQKKVLEAEQRAIDKIKSEQEAAREVAKEREMQQYEQAGDISQRDPRAHSLKFMYSQPKNRDSDDETEKDESSHSHKTKEPSPYLGLPPASSFCLNRLQRSDKKMRWCELSKTN